MPPTEQLLILIDPGLKKRAKFFALEKDITLRNLVETAIEKFIGASPTGEIPALEKNHFKCMRCAEEWDSEKKQPKACPFCKSYSWNTPRKERLTSPPKEKKSYHHECVACCHTWTNGIELPKACPVCSSLAWDKTGQLYLRKQFEHVYLGCGKGVSTHDIASFVGMSAIQISRYVMAKDPLTPEILEQFTEGAKRFKESPAGQEFPIW